MLWLCLRFPRLPLTALAMDDSDRPMALARQRRIELANRCAEHDGIQIGQPLSTAQALSPALSYRTRDRAAEMQLLQQLGLWAYQFTPEVSLREPDTLLLRLDPSLRLFKGFQRLYQGLTRGLKRRGQYTEWGLAHTAEAAFVLSHSPPHSPDQLVNPDDQRLDIEQVEARLMQTALKRLPNLSDHGETLAAMGLHRLGDLLSLPAKALNKRFGAELGDWLDRLTGITPDPQRYFEPPPVFYAERRYLDGLHSKQQLRFPIAALLGDLGTFSRIRQWRVNELQWQLLYADNQRQHIDLTVSSSRFNRQNLLELMVLKLDQLALLAGQVDCVSLHCDHFEPIEAVNGALFADTAQTQQQNREQYQRLLDRLSTRLSPESCYTLASRDSHLPETAWQRNEPSTALSGKTLATATPDGLRPLWLLPQPAPVRQRGKTLFWQGELTLLQGPERIDSHWWQQRQIRDYYIARRSDGSLFWIYKDCVQRSWFVHGVFG